MIPLTVLIDFPSPLQILVNAIAAAIAKLNLEFDTPPALEPLPIWSLDIPQQMRFVSPLPLKLASRYQSSPQEVGTRILAEVEPLLLVAKASPVTDQLNFQLSLEASGWLSCQLSHASIASWLQLATENPPHCSGFHPSAELSEPFQTAIATLDPSESAIFALQYAHARCCSLIRLAHQTGLLQLVEPHVEQSPAYWQLVPKPIPWLDEDHLRFGRSQEWALIRKILDFPGSLGLPRSRWPTPNASATTPTIPVAVPILWPLPEQILRQQIITWSETFADFHRHCRIWGEVSTKTPKLAQARLGLLVATQTVLRFLLQDMLAVAAPKEL